MILAEKVFAKDIFFEIYDIRVDKIMTQAVLFDMDGLIIDNEPLHSKAFEIVLKLYGKKPRFNENGLVQILGIGGKENWKLLKKIYQLSEDEEVLLQKKRIIYLDLLKQNIKPMPGLLKLLKFLKKKRIKMAIASSASLSHIELITKSLGIRHYFKAIISGESVMRGKPDPDIYLKAAKLLKVKPYVCLVLEDTERGVIAGKRARMKVIAVPTKYTKHLNFSQADKVVRSLEEVERLI